MSDDLENLNSHVLQETSVQKGHKIYVFTWKECPQWKMHNENKLFCLIQLLRVRILWILFLRQRTILGNLWKKIALEWLIQIFAMCLRTLIWLMMNGIGASLSPGFSYFTYETNPNSFHIGFDQPIAENRAKLPKLLRFHGKDLSGWKKAQLYYWPFKFCFCQVIP